MRTLRLSRLAANDIEDILQRSHSTFGALSRNRYETLIERALIDIAGDPDKPGVRRREELGAGFRSYHLFHSRGRGAGRTVSKPRHLLIFRLSDPNLLDVARVIHDSMDLIQHLQDD